MSMEQKFDGFDIHHDVIGDDPVVGGVVYNASEWVADHEGVIRRSEHAREYAPTTQERAEDEILERAEALGHEFAAAIRNISTGPTISDLLRRYSQLLRDAEEWDVQPSRIEAVIDAATHHA